MTARVALGEVADFINGVAFKPDDWEENGKRIIRIQNLTDPSKPFNRTNRLVDRKYHVSPGDLLVSWSATLGVFEWSGPDTALVNQHIFRVVPDDGRVLKQYLKHMLADAIVEMEGHLHGATMKHVNRREFLATKIPLPPLPEQKRIAKILDAADALRAKRRESLAQLDALLQSTFLEMFGDPVENPKGWSLKVLGDLGELERGVSKHRPRNDPVLLGGPYPLIQTGEVANSEGYIRSFRSTYSEQGLAQSRIWPSGTLCITIAANIASTGILTFEACFPDSVVGFRSEEDGRVEYVQGLFWFLKAILEARAPQVAQKNINLKILRSLPVPLPPAELQRRFAKVVQSVERQRQTQRRGLKASDSLFASLQRRAFAGQL